MDIAIPEVSEDCLYLNVYTPAKPAEDAKLPVSSIADWPPGPCILISAHLLYCVNAVVFQDSKAA